LTGDAVVLRRDDTAPVALFALAFFAFFGWLAHRFG
jgi:hypothetical protein